MERFRVQQTWRIKSRFRGTSEDIWKEAAAQEMGRERQKKMGCQLAGGGWNGDSPAVTLFTTESAEKAEKGECGCLQGPWRLQLLFRLPLNP